MWIDPAELLKKHRYLLEDDFAQLGEKSAPDKEYWMSSVESAVPAAKDGRRRNRGDRQRSGTYAYTAMQDKRVELDNRTGRKKQKVYRRTYRRRKR